jgi:hypothetical protein
MHVKMLVSMAGPLGVREPGQVIEVDEEEAARLIAAGFAVPEKGEVETANVEPPEKAVLPRGKPRKAVK